MKPGWRSTLIAGFAVAFLNATAHDLETSAGLQPRVCAKEVGQFPIPLYQKKAIFNLSFENVAMPNNQQMGFAGFNYLVQLTDFIYTGVGGYGAITGNEGGLFSLGLSAGLRHTVLQNLGLDAGVYVGGGGRKPEIVGGGLMVRPHIGVFYDFALFGLELDYAAVYFPSGQINSKELAFAVNIPTSFNYSLPERFSNLLTATQQVIPMQGGQVEFQRDFLGFFEQNYFQAQTVPGTTPAYTINLAGFQIGHYFTRHVFSNLQLSGAFSGMKHGYMDVLLGLGWSQYVMRYLEGFAVMNVGAGGGGPISTGGGLLLNPQLGLRIWAFPTISAEINGGYIAAPQGALSAAVLGFHLNYWLNLAYASHAKNAAKQLLQENCENIFPWVRFDNWRLRALSVTYLHPQRTQNAVTSAIGLLAIQPDLLLTDWFYLTGQGAAAYQGYQAGSLATGLIGVGLQTPLLAQHLRLFSEFMVGAAGGGGLALGSGAVLQPNAGVFFQFNPWLGLQLGAGYIRSIQSSLSTPVLNGGLTLQFSTLDGEKRVFN